VPIVFSANIIRTVLTNVRLGMPRVSLQLVHNDLVWSTFFSFFSGCKYVLTLIDEFSRHTWVYLLKIKIEVFDNFLAYKALVEKKLGHQIQRLIT
jgi:hypothetical protein